MPTYFVRIASHDIKSLSDFCKRNSSAVNPLGSGWMGLHSGTLLYSIQMKEDLMTALKLTIMSAQISERMYESTV